MPMQPPSPPDHRASDLAGAGAVIVVTLAALAAALASGSASAATAGKAATARSAAHVNVSAGGPLRPGVYGRIETRGQAAPPPVVYAAPTLAVAQAGAQQQQERKPVYLYVPPGQVRKWPQHCRKWDACATPVYFVRMDDSPSRLGKWKVTARDAAQGRALLHALLQ